MWQQSASSSSVATATLDMAVLIDPDPLVAEGSNFPAASAERTRPVVLVVLPAHEPDTAYAPRLRTSGYEAYPLRTACEAIELAESKLPDAIVLDLDGRYAAGAPGGMISGFRLLQVCWQVTRAHPTALVVLTTMDFAEVEGAMRARVQAFINKPVAPARLSDCLRAALGRLTPRRPAGDYALAHTLRVAVETG